MNTDGHNDGWKRSNYPCLSSSILFNADNPDDTLLSGIESVQNEIRVGILWIFNEISV